MTQKKKPMSNSRLRERELQKKFIPAIKAMSEHMFTVNPETPEKHFHGHKIPCGNFVDDYGIKVQLQLHAVRVKSQFMKKNEIRPILNKWSILFKLRLITKSFIDNLFKD